MQIDAISSITSIGQTSSLTKAAAAAPTVVRATTTAAKAPVSTSTSVAQPAVSTGKSPSPAAAAASQSSAVAAEETLAAVYSTSVGGKNYSGSVEESDGEYTASVADLAGASASGSSIESAENNLGTVLDTLV
jgi:hypothetical protein